MKKNIFAFLLMLPFHLALAYDVTIEVNGSVVTESCNISGKDLLKNIEFPELDPKDFMKIGSTSVTLPISIGLEKCTGNISVLYYKFSGTPDDTDPTLLKVTGKNGATEGSVASGLAVEFLDRYKRKLILNNTYNIPGNISSPTYSLDFYLRYKSVSNDVEPGDASSVAYLDIYYE